MAWWLLHQVASSNQHLGTLLRTSLSMDGKESYLKLFRLFLFLCLAEFMPNQRILRLFALVLGWVVMGDLDRIRDQF